jgi:hypothetical protein
MLLEAGFLCAVLRAARDYCRAGAQASPPSRASLFLLQWEWFRIYFESGMVKLAQRRSRVAQLHRHGRVLPERSVAHVDRLVCRAPAALVHAFATVAGTLVLELAMVFMLFFPRRVRLHVLLHRHALGDRVILTANYTFLNYLVFSLGFLLLDDKFLLRFVPAACRPHERVPLPERSTCCRIAAVHPRTSTISPPRDLETQTGAKRPRTREPARIGRIPAAHLAIASGPADLDRLRHHRADDRHCLAATVPVFTAPIASRSNRSASPTSTASLP